jgi:7-cyano-7-deazaguanine synthase
MKGLALCSGGMDSTVMLYDYQDSITGVVYFNYGSKQNAIEIKYAEYHCKKLKKKFNVVDLNFFDSFKSTLLSNRGTVPFGLSYSARKSTYVPFRNGIFLSIAGGMCEFLDYDSVYLAVNMEGWDVYKDCSEDFIHNMKYAIKFGTNKSIDLYAPYLNKDKEYIVKQGIELEVEIKKTYSCYRGGEIPCGKCAPCINLKEIFTRLDVK